VPAVQCPVAGLQGAQNVGELFCDVNLAALHRHEMAILSPV
jgi:hypothetical protein